MKEKDFYQEQVDIEKLKMKRKEKKVLQKDMAKILGCSTTTYCDKEKLRCRYTYSDIKKIKEYLGLTREETIDIFFKNIL